ncbi:hypothetical protein J6590_056875 [Homalodisca vitripennis]|nr:hypothetical protein J6590_056875 [Homalodisca vitripennis]
MVYTYRHREALPTLPGPLWGVVYGLCEMMGGVIEMTVNLTNAYYVASTLYRRLPPVIRDLRAEPTGLFKRLVTTWLRMIGSDNAEVRRLSQNNRMKQRCSCLDGEPVSDSVFASSLPVRPLVVVVV